VKLMTKPIYIYDSRNQLPKSALYLLKQMIPSFSIYLVTNGPAPLSHANLVHDTIESLNLKASLEKFHLAYVHLSPNSVEYERACFERYFAYRALSEKYRHKSFWVLDSDVWAFPSLGLWEDSNRAVFSAKNESIAVSAHCAFMTNRHIHEFTDFVVNSYYHKSRRAELLKLYEVKKQKGGGINDMTALSAWLQSTALLWINSETIHLGPLVSHIFPEIESNSGAAFRFIANDSFASLETTRPRSTTKYSAIHFQGSDKLVPIFLKLCQGKFLPIQLLGLFRSISSFILRGGDLITRIGVSTRNNSTMK
jgi:hypothetical protein